MSTAAVDLDEVFAIGSSVVVPDRLSDVMPSRFHYKATEKARTLHPITTTIHSREFVTSK